MNYQSILNAAFDPALANQLLDRTDDPESLLAQLASAGMTDEVFDQVVEIRKSMAIRDGDGDGLVDDGLPTERPSQQSMQSKVREMYGLPPKPLSDWAKEKFGDNAQNFLDWFGDSKIVGDDGLPVVVYHGTNREFEAFDSKRIGQNTGNEGHMGYGLYLSFEKGEAETYGDKMIEAYVSMQNPFRLNADSADLLRANGVDWIDEKRDFSLDYDTLLDAMEKKDPVASDLLRMLKDHGDDAWDVFFEKHPGWKDHKGIDLNDVRDLFEMSQKVENDDYNDPLPYYANERLEQYGLEGVKINTAFHHAPTMHWITDLGNRAKEVTDAIKKLGHDGVIVGSEIVVFDPNQIKSVNNAGSFDRKNTNIYKATQVLPEKTVELKPGWVGDAIKDLVKSLDQRDGDGDGFVNDGTESERSVRKKDPRDNPNFLKWFGDSKVVNPDGSPLVVYHGTSADFEGFDDAKTGANDLGLWGKGHYFASSPETANSYALRQGDGARLIPAYVSIQNPLVLKTGKDLVTRLPDGRDYRTLVGSNLDGSKIKQIAQAGGHDGVIQIKPDGSIGDVVAYRSGQVKSAISNNGQFDPIDNRINKAGPSQLGLFEEIADGDGDGLIYDGTPQERPSRKKTATTKGEAFEAWFGNSKVVDSEGNPLVLFHGTTNEFDEFNNPYADDAGGNWHMFSAKPEYSDNFANGTGGRLVPVYLRVEKPFDLTHLPVRRGDVRNKLLDEFKEAGLDVEELNKKLPHERDLYQFINRRGFRGLLMDQLKAKGYDGIRMPDAYDGPEGSVEAETWIVFDGAQIKSAITNSGEYSRSDKRINKSVRDGDGDGKIYDGKSNEQPVVKVNLDMKHHEAIGTYLESNLGQGVSPAKIAEITGGLDPKTMLTGDDQNLIMFYSGVLGDDDIGRAMWGDAYDPKLPEREQAEMKLATFVIKLNGAMNKLSRNAVLRDALEKVKDAKVVSFRNSRGGKLILHPAVRPDRESDWQLSTVGPDGTPYGHNHPPTFEEGVARALNASKDHYWNESGYSLDEIHKSVGFVDIIDRDSDGMIYDGTPWERSAPSKADDYKTLGVRSRAFKDWFGDWENGKGSKVLDLDGYPSENVEIDGTSDVPLVMYHGSAKGGFDEFNIKYNDKSEGLLYGPGFYFTDDQDIAKEYMGKDSYIWNEMNESEMDAYTADIGMMVPDTFKLVQYPREEGFGAYVEIVHKNDPTFPKFTIVRESNDKPGRWLVDEEMTLPPLLQANMPQVYSYMKSLLPTTEVKKVYLNIRNPLKIEGEVRTDDIVAEIDSIIKSGDFSGYPGYASSPLDVKTFIDPKLKDRLTKIRDNIVKWSNGEFIPGKGLYNELSGHGKDVAFWLLKECGYDGITHIGGQVMGNKSHRVWIAFYPNQIKAVDNVGTFDPSTGNIYKGSFWRRVVDGYKQAFGSPKQGKPVTDPSKPKTTKPAAANSGGPAPKQQPAPVSGPGGEKDGDGDGLVNDGTSQERPVSQSASVPDPSQQGQSQPQLPQGGAGGNAGSWEPEDSGPVVAEVKDQAAWKSLRDGNRNKFKEMIGGSNLSPERKQEYLTHMQTALNAMPIGAQQLVAENIKSTQWYENAQDLSASSAKILGIQLNEGEVIQGLYVSGSGTNPVGGEMHLDSGRDAVGTYLHEMAHGFDWDKQSGDRISSGQDWNKAWETEIVAGKLSAYGKTAAIEGFAEFARLVYANGETGRQIARKHFPQCTAIFERNGLL